MMNDRNGQEHLLEMIDRLLAGKQAPPKEKLTAEESQLLDVARRLKEESPAPPAGFEDRLAARFSGPEPRGLLPRWLTLPRVAAVAAALVIGLGTIGLTAAVIRGPGQNGVSRIEMAPRDEQAGSAAGNSISGPTSPIPGGQDASRAQSEPGTGGTGPAPDGESAAAGAGDSLPSLQKVIQTADYDIEVGNGEFQGKYDQVAAVAVKYGGYVVSADSRSGDGSGQPQSGTVTIRVASSGDGFNKAMQELDGLGTVKSRKVSGQDVTEQYIDLQSRLRNAQSREASLLALMQKAQSIDEILQVQTRLDEVQAEIEQLKGRISYMDSRTDFATISVRLHEQGETVEETSGLDWGFVDALRYAGWLAVQTVNFIIMALAVILPLAVAMTLTVYAIYRFILWRTSSH